jgi:hypothetical protein
MFPCSTFRLLMFAIGFLTPTLASATSWQTPTPQELSMTAEPAVPGAAAEYLYREEISDNYKGIHFFYIRLKVLTEAGKKYGDIEIPYEKGDNSYNLGKIDGRTIHKDGSVIPLTGKPLDKFIEKSSGLKYWAKVLSFPDVQVGSILEYTYQFEDAGLQTPTWYIQSDLYLRKGFFRYVPYKGPTWMGNGLEATNLMVFPILPVGTAVREIASKSEEKHHSVPDAYELDVENIAPQPDEEFLPPIHSLTYRVDFRYAAYPNTAEFWKNEGKNWSARLNNFMSPHPSLAAAVNQWTLPADSQEVKLQKIYAGIMAFENTDFTRQRSEKEDKSEGFKAIKDVQDILARKRGNSDQLTLLFVALARAAGMKAYVMAVTNRDSDLFRVNLLSFRQLDDAIAIVNLDGKERYFDPGQRYCVFGQLHWMHTLATGIRQTETGTEIATTPDNAYNDSKTVRIAALKMDAQGVVSGSVQVGYTGSPALSWRQRALLADQAEVEKNMEDELRLRLPDGLTVKLMQLANLNDPARMLTAKFSVDGQLGSVTSKRLFIPVEIFQASSKPRFTQSKREMPVYFSFTYQDYDQVSISFPPGLSVETLPLQEKFTMQKMAAMQEGVEVKDNKILLTRNFGLASEIFKTEEYDDLRTFFGKVIRKDKEQLVMKVAS